MTQPHNDPDELFSLINSKENQVIPLGFYLVRSMPIGQGHEVFLTEKSPFHQTTLYGVGSYHKPIAFILEEDLIINE